MICPGTTLPETGVTPSSKNAAFASVRFGLMTVRSMKPSSNVAGCPTDRPRRYSVSFEPPATFATLYTTAIVCDAAGASVMRALSPATPFPEPRALTVEPGPAAARHVVDDLECDRATPGDPDARQRRVQGRQCAVGRGPVAVPCHRDHPCDGDVLGDRHAVRAVPRVRHRERHRVRGARRGGARRGGVGGHGHAGLESDCH